MAVQNPRICINALLLPGSLGGIGNYTFHLIKNLQKLRPDLNLTLLVNRDATPNFRDLIGLNILEVNIRSRIGRLAYLHLVFPFLANRYHLLHSVGNMGLVLCPTAQVITIHDAYECVSPERFSFGKRMLMRLLVAVSGLVARKILTDSENSGRDIARFYPHLASKVSVVRLGNKFPVGNTVKTEGRNGFLFVGTVEPGKNLALVMRAFARFLKLHPEGGKLKVVGAMGWKQTGLPGLMDSLGITDSVEILGYVPDNQLPVLFDSSVALIQASNYEGFGLPVIEAMACGCPVISAHNSALIEAGGDSALFFETGDIEGLFGRMEEVFGSLEIRRQCIVSGFVHVSGFTWENVASKTQLAYEKALENRP